MALTDTNHLACRPVRFVLPKIKPKLGPNVSEATKSVHWAALTLKGQEALLALMLEPHGELIDDLAETMDADEAAAVTLDGSVRIGDFLAGLAARHDMALTHDYAAAEDTPRFWYVSVPPLQ